MELENEFQILCRLDVSVHILKEFLWGYTGIDLGRPNIGVSQHLADGFYRDTVFKRHQGRERVPRNMGTH